MRFEDVLNATTSARLRACSFESSDAVVSHEGEAAPPRVGVSMTRQPCASPSVLVQISVCVWRVLTFRPPVPATGDTSHRHTTAPRTMPSVQQVEDLLRAALEADTVKVTDISGE